MKRAALVAPEFPPSNTAGAHRPRLLAKHLPSFGWTPTIITVRPDQFEGPLDPTLEGLVAPNLDIIRTSALPVRPVRLIGDIGLRSLPTHAMALARLCRQKGADAVVLFGPPWFSFVLGPFVRRWFDIPYLLDYIDPWISDWSARHRFPSKGWLYHRAAAALEPIVLRSAASVTAVSEGILLELHKRYPWLRAEKLSAMPYGAEPDDLEAAERLGVTPPDFCQGDGVFNVCFTGAFQPRGGELLRGVFESVKVLRDQQPSIGNRIRLRFYGTSNLTWGRGRYRVLPIAREMRLGDLVSEIPERIPYLQAMAVLRACDVVLVMGSWEHYYHASKLYPAIVSGKPVLALCHRESSIVGVMAETGAGACIAFEGPDEVERRIPEISTALIALLQREGGRDRRPADRFERFSARASARTLATALDHAIGSG